MKRHYNDFLNDIIVEIEIIKQASSQITFNEFKENKILVRAITKSLEIIGEAVKNLPESLKEKYGEVEWRRIKGFRDVVSHKWAVDLYYEWDIIKSKVDILEKQIKEIIRKEGERKEKKIEK